MLTKDRSASLKKILLVDDNQADNMIHRRLLEKLNVAQHIVDFLYAEDALNYLKSPEGADTDLIFLDINMPQMNGFEFMDEFKMIRENPDDLPAVVMVSTSNPNWDKDAIENYPLIRRFFSKPLTDKLVMEIIQSVE